MTDTFILFPASSVNPNRPDLSFETEAAAAKSAGFSVAYVEQAIHFGGEPSFRQLPKEPSNYIYRGWILSDPAYLDMTNALYADKHIAFNNSVSYSIGINLPKWYPKLERFTPNSFWTQTTDTISPQEVAEFVKSNTCGQPLILKDYLKSRKHEWDDACFMPNSWDTVNVARVVENFIKLQGDCLQGGLVFRDFIEFEEMGRHPKSGTPIIHEVRQFYLTIKGDTIPFYRKNYWPELDLSAELPAEEFVVNVGNRVGLPLFVVDFGLTKAGHWIPIEVNDGGMAGLPDPNDADSFYESLRKCLTC